MLFLVRAGLVRSNATSVESTPLFPMCLFVQMTPCGPNIDAKAPTCTNAQVMYGETNGEDCRTSEPD
jgi:hypothetical protein